MEFDKYIPSNYIDNAFKVFIEHGLIRKTKDKLKVAPVISGRFGTVKFYPLMQQMYERVENSNTADIQKFDIPTRNSYLKEIRLSQRETAKTLGLNSEMIRRTVVSMGLSP